MVTLLFGHALFLGTAYFCAISICLCFVIVAYFRKGLCYVFRLIHCWNNYLNSCFILFAGQLINLSEGCFCYLSCLCVGSFFYFWSCVSEGVVCFLAVMFCGRHCFYCVIDLLHRFIIGSGIFIFWFRYILEKISLVFGVFY